MIMQYKVNDIIKFIGNEHFESSTSKKGKSCKSGLAKISNIAYEKDLHPIHIIAEACDNADVYGWVSIKDIKPIIASEAIQRLAYLQVINSPEYWQNITNQIKYLDKLFINSCQCISTKKNNNLDLDAALNKLITAKIINTPEYWQEQVAKYNNIYHLIIKLASSIDDNATTTALNTTTSNNNSEKNRTNFVKTAQSYLGYNEWDYSHRTIVDIYNNYGNLPIGYKVSYYDSWCATFVSAIAILCGLADTIIPRECSCERQIELFKKLGSWVEDDNYMPKSGDIVYYTWDGDEYTSNTQWADHVGIIVNAITENEILVIEGNKNDQVAYRTIWRNHPYVRGYATPKY